MTNPYGPDTDGAAWQTPVPPGPPPAAPGTMPGHAIPYPPPQSPMPGQTGDLGTHPAPTGADPAWAVATPPAATDGHMGDLANEAVPQEGSTVVSPFDGVPAVRVVNVDKIYGLERGATPVRALDNVSIDLPAGRFTAIMGPSGSGKSTLLQTMAGLDTVTNGQIFIGDTELTALDENGRTKLRRDKIGFVFQAYNLVSSLTARENIVLPARLAGRKWDEAWLDELVATLGLGERMGHRPTQMSGGQQQRVAAARALLTRPEVIFGDEPTGALDSVTSAELLEFLQRAVAEHGQTIVIVTHDPFAASHADWVVFLADGKIVDTLADPSPDDVLDTMRRLGR